MKGLSIVLLKTKLMNKKQTSTTISIIAIIAVASFTTFQITEITAEEIENKGYVSAEDITITVEFTFQDGIEVSQFEVFDQLNGFDATKQASFKLEKIVSQSTPRLHNTADGFQHLSRSSGSSWEHYRFDANIILAQGGSEIRTFDYKRCIVTDYKVDTLFDKEEGWTTSKGFAVIDEFEITCDGYTPFSQTYYDLTNGHKKANTESSIDYQNSQLRFQ
jgi:hypothetical protein